MRKNISASLLILLTILIISSTEVTLKFLGNGMPPGGQLNFWRFLLGGIFLLFLAKRKKISFALVPQIILYASLFIVVSMTLYQLAIYYNEAFLVAVCFSINPLFAQITDHWLKENQTPVLASLFFSLIGLALITFAMPKVNLLGLLLAGGAAFLFGAYSSLNKRFIIKHHLDTVAITGYTFIVGALALLLISCLFQLIPVAKNPLSEFFSALPYEGLTLHQLPSLLFLSIVITAGGFLLYFICQQKFSQLAPLIFYAKPAVSSLLALIILQETLNLGSVCGILLILLGNGCTLYHSRKKSTPQLLKTKKTKTSDRNESV